MVAEHHAYHIRIQQANMPEAVLAFPVGVAGLVESLFLGAYNTGQEFLTVLEAAKGQMLDAIVAAYPSSPRSFSYSLNSETLVLRLSATQLQRRVLYRAPANDINAMKVMAMLVANYVHLKQSIDTQEGPVTVKTSYDSRIEQSFVDIGLPAAEEFDLKFGVGTNDASDASGRCYLKIECDIRSGN